MESDVRRMRYLTDIGEGEIPDHDLFTERLRRTLYYGKMPENDRPSLAMTEIAVEVIQKAAPRELGKVDMQWAASVGRHACVSPCSLMLSMMYIERLRHKNPEYLQQISSSELFLVSMMVASKYLYDEGVEEEVFNDEWAESAKMETNDINLLEMNFLSAIDWSLFAKQRDFQAVLKGMEHRIAWKKTRERGWMTYTDFAVLCRDQMMIQQTVQLLHEISKVIVVCSVAYMAASMTMVGSVVTLHAIRKNTPPPPNLPDISWLASPATWQDSLPMVPPPSHQITNSISSGTLGPISAVISEGIHHRDVIKKADDVNDTDYDIFPSAAISHTVSEHDPPTLTPSSLTGSRLMALPIQGLLTLVVIKDTLVKFALGLKEKFNVVGESHVDESEEIELNTTDVEMENHCGHCSCRNCPLQGGSNESSGLMSKQMSSYWYAVAQSTLLNVHNYLLRIEKEMGGNGQVANELCPHGVTGLPDCAGPPVTCGQQYPTYQVYTSFPDLAERHHTAGRAITG